MLVFPLILQIKLNTYIKPILLFMKHVNLLLLASSLMLSCPDLAQKYKQVWSDEFNNLEDKNWNFEEGTRDQGFGNW